MRRLIVSKKAILGDRIHITDKEDIAYLSIVLRMKEGDTLLVLDGEGRAWETSIDIISRNKIELSVLSENQAYEDDKTRVTLYQGLPRGVKMEEVVRKATELGVFRIVPVTTARVEAGSANTSAFKYERWRRVAKEASRQSQRLVVPEISNVLDSEEAAVELVNGDYDLILIPYELEERRTLKQALRDFGARTSDNGAKPLNIAVFIGPEGGFESAEIEKLVREGAEPVTMGDTILRTETAGPAAVAMILYELEL